MTERTNRATIRHLEQHGPTTGSELPRHPEPKDRHLGVRKFNLQMGSKGNGSGVGRPTPVYYLDGDHLTKEVVDVWVSLNDSVLKNSSHRAIYRRTSERFREDMKQYLDEVSNNPRGMKAGESNMEGTCALCGEEYTNSLAKHLPCGGVE